VAAPIPRVAIVLGRLLATAVIAVAQATFFLLLGLAFGAHVEGGAPGFLIVLGIAAVAGTGFGAIGMVLALRARNASTVQGIFPLVFVVLFISSAFFPRALLVEPARTIAHYNPLSFIADGLRDPIVSSISAKAVLEGVAAAGGVALVSIALCVQSLRRKLGEA
jgi:ABC-2 type transport system permease protein